MKSCPFCAEDIQDAAIVCRHCNRDLKVVPKAGWLRRRWRPSVFPPVAVVLLVLSLVALEAVSRSTINLGRKPVTITDEVQNVPAASWKAILLVLPYSGSLEVSLDVVRGNPLDVFLTGANQLDTMKQGEWNNVRAYPDFNATKTTAFRRTAMLGAGDYYLVIRDTSLGILSSRASDVSLKAHLKP